MSVSEDRPRRPADEREVPEAGAKPKPPHPSRRRNLGIAAVLVVTAGIFIARSRSRTTPDSPAGGHDRAVPVSVATAKIGDVPIYLDGLGSVTALANVTMRTRVDGQLMSVRFREGDRVHSGDLLAEIDPRPFQVQLDQARGQLAKDQALLANAHLDLARYQLLFKQDSVAKQQLDAEQSLVKQYEAALQVDQALIESAELQLVYCHITSPIDGRLGLRLVDAGNIVHASDSGGLVTIAQLQPIAVVFTIPEDDLVKVRTRLGSGEALKVEAYDREQRRVLAVGTLLTTDNQVDPGTGTLRLKAEFPNDDEALFPNQFVNARLLVDVRKGSVVIPSVAVQRGSQGTFVFVVKDDKTVEVRSVKIDVVEKADTAIASGLQAGDVVVVDGVDGLHDRSKVEVPAAKEAKPPGHE